jgi:hypothetical protein
MSSGEVRPRDASAGGARRVDRHAPAKSETATPMPPWLPERQSGTKYSVECMRQFTKHVTLATKPLRDTELRWFRQVVLEAVKEAHDRRLAAGDRDEVSGLAVLSVRCLADRLRVRLRQTSAREQKVSKQRRISVEALQDFSSAVKELGTWLKDPLRSKSSAIPILANTTDLVHRMLRLGGAEPTS